MLPGAGLRDDARLAHPPREQNLPQAVIDLVRAGVEQILALEINLRAAQCFAQALGVIERRGTAGVVDEEIRQLRLKLQDPRTLRGRLARALRAAPSELRARSGRRRVRSGRWNRVAMSLCCVQGGLHKLPNLFVILHCRAKTPGASWRRRPRAWRCESLRRRSKRRVRRRRSLSQPRLAPGSSRKRSRWRDRPAGRPQHRRPEWSQTRARMRKAFHTRAPAGAAPP